MLLRYPDKERGEEEKASIRWGQSRLPHRPASGMGYGSVISSLTWFKLSIATQPSMLRTGPGGICSHTVVSGTQSRKSRSRTRHSILGTQTSASHLLPSAGHRLCVNLSQHACLVGWDPSRQYRPGLHPPCNPQDTSGPGLISLPIHSLGLTLESPQRKEKGNPC